MSGGFFRGTSAEQDTRFSNKQAKLLKSQKFAPELEHLVDVSKVKMDVIKPWIAQRVTELLGFEDEVLINFIYGLLEGKEINGKAVQIQLTGFMEKNTGKFMKELWALLISAQKNASGVPQQFLDAKEEETRKKKAETDRIFDEIQRRKEKEREELEQERPRKMDGAFDNSPAESHRRERGSGTRSGDENGDGATNGFRRRDRSSKSPYSSDHSPLPHRTARSRSISKSYSNSRSYSKERSRSRSISASPRGRKRSVSSGRSQSPQRSFSPKRRLGRESLSPRHVAPGRRPSRTRHRSPSPWRRRVRSPGRRRSPSPLRRRSRTPVRRRSPSPLLRRSRTPLRRRSPSPWRRRSRSPWRRRSRSPRRHRSPSPVRRRGRRSMSSSMSQSPVHRRPLSPVRRRYQSPIRRRSPYRVRRRSPSPYRRRPQSPGGRRSKSPVRRRSMSPVGRHSRSPVHRRSSSPVRRMSPVPARRRSFTPPNRSRSLGSQSSGSPARRSSVSPVKMKSPRFRRSPSGSPLVGNRMHESATMLRKQPISLSPQRVQSERKRLSRKVPSVSPSPEKSPSNLGSPQARIRSYVEHRSRGKVSRDERSLDGSRSPPSKLRDQSARHGSPAGSEEGLRKDREIEEHKSKSAERGSVRTSNSKRRESPERSVMGRHHESADSRRKVKEMSEEVLKEARASKKSPHKVSLSGERTDMSHPGDGLKSDEKRSSRSKDARDNSKSDSVVKSLKMVEKSPTVESDSGSEENDKRRSAVAEKRKHRRSSRREAASEDTSSESEMEDRKEAKRRRKEEKKIRKEERRRRREERRRRKEEKRSSKRKRKSKDVDASSSDMEKYEKETKASDGERDPRKHISDDEDTESQKKRLERELREKALESLRAKKGISR